VFLPVNSKKKIKSTKGQITSIVNLNGLNLLSILKASYNDINIRFLIFSLNAINLTFFLILQKNKEKWMGTACICNK
jgi:hypothetical protein